MKIGVVYPQTELEGNPDAVHELGVLVDTLGYDHLLAYDHVLGATHDREPRLQGLATNLDSFHDPFVLFSYVAAITKRIQLITGVLVLPQRPTALVAKQAADLDLLSHQRLILGVGTGWNYVEYSALGHDFHTRGQRADEQIPLLRRLWTEKLISFEGRFDRIDRADINPRPKRSIPIWVGGFAEAAFRRAGRFGDGFIFIGDIESVKQQWARVQHHLSEAKRRPENFARHLLLYGLSDIASIRDAIEKWRDAGGTHASIVCLDKGRPVQAHCDYLSETYQGLAGIL